MLKEQNRCQFKKIEKLQLENDELKGKINSTEVDQTMTSGGTQENPEDKKIKSKS